MKNRSEKASFLKRLAQGKARIEDIQTTVLYDPSRENYRFTSSINEPGIYTNDKGERFTTGEARAFIKNNRRKYNFTVFEVSKPKDSERIFTEDDKNVITFS